MGRLSLLRQHGLTLCISWLNAQVVFLIFVSGRIIITGAKTEANMREALSKLLPYIYQFKKTIVTTAGGGRAAGRSSRS